MVNDDDRQVCGYVLLAVPRAASLGIRSALSGTRTPFSLGSGCEEAVFVRWRGWASLTGARASGDGIDVPVAKRWGMRP